LGEGCAPLGEKELGPHLTQCDLSKLPSRPFELRSLVLWAGPQSRQFGPRHV